MIDCPLELSIPMNFGSQPSDDLANILVLVQAVFASKWDSSAWS